MKKEYRLALTRINRMIGILPKIVPQNDANIAMKSHVNKSVPLILNEAQSALSLLLMFEYENISLDDEFFYYLEKSEDEARLALGKYIYLCETTDNERLRTITNDSYFLELYKNSFDLNFDGEIKNET